jgi:6-phospho-beta-glucosidase
MHFRLVGRSAEHLQAVSRAAEILTRNSSISLETFSVDGDPGRFLRGAAVILIQARFGGLQGRLFDESFPLRYALPGDEGLGPGGLSAAYRSWPRLQDLLADIASHAPNAFVILLTSPVGILTRLACSSFPALRIAGICELPWTTLQDICRTVGVSWDSVHYAYAGVNHIGWFHEISAAGRNLVEEYARRRDMETPFPSGMLIRNCRAVPLKYLRLHYEPERVLAEQRILPPRSEVLMRIADRAMEVFLRGSHEEIIAILPSRPAPWYEHAVGPLLLALAGGRVSIPFFLTTPGGAGDVRERPHEFRWGDLKPTGNGSEPPRAIADLLRGFVNYERLAAEAVMDRDGEKLAQALAEHPWLRGRRLPTNDIAQEITRAS